MVPDFTGKSFLEYPTLQNVGKAFAIEIWFLPRAYDGVLLYNGQEGERSRDFIAINLKNGHVEFTYNLGSGPAHLV